MDAPTRQHLTHYAARWITVGATSTWCRMRRAEFKAVHLNLRSVDALRAALVDHAPHVVCCFNLAGLGGFGLLQFLAVSQMPTVAVMMDNWFQGAAAWHGTAALRRWFAIPNGLCGAQLVACSRNLLGEVEAELGEAVPNPVLIPAWVEIDRLGGTLPTADETVRFLFNSQLIPPKGIELVIAAAAALRSAGVDGFTIDLFGTGDIAGTLQRAYANGLGPIVRYCGTLPKVDMMRRYAGYDALLFPTWEREPSGFVASEAASAGCIPIITARAGASEYLLDGHDCIKIVRSTEALEAAMRRVVAMPLATRLAFRQRVGRSARRIFDARIWFDELERVLEETARPSAAAGDPDAAYAALALLGQIWKSDHG